MSEPLFFPAIFFIGVLLALRGWLGRRAGVHPVCRKCGYDLFGTRGTVCPECHTDGARRAPYRGVRVRLRPVLLTGLALASIGVIGTIPHAQSVNYYQYAPLQTLIGAANVGMKGAYDELKVRIENDKLSPAEIDELARRALDIQRDADVHAVHFAGWMDVLRKLFTSDKLTNPQESRMDTQHIRSVEIDVRNSIRRGEILPIRIRVTRTLSYRDVRFSVESIRVADELAFPLYEPDPLISLIAFEPIKSEFVIDRNYELLFPFAEGASTIEIIALADESQEYFSGTLSNTRSSLVKNLARLYQIDPRSFDKYIADANTAALMQRSSITLKDITRAATLETEKSNETDDNSAVFTVNVLPIDATDDITLRSSGTLDQQVRSALIARGLFTQVVRPTEEGFESFTYYSPYIMLQYRTPIAIAMEASIEIDGTRMVLGDVWAEARSQQLNVDFKPRGEFKELEAKNIDVLLTPKPDLARRTVDVYEIWGGTYGVGPITIGRIDDVKKYKDEDILSSRSQRRWREQQLKEEREKQAVRQKLEELK